MKRRSSLSAVCRHLGGPEAVMLEATDPREPGDQDVVIDVKAASLNFPDLLMTYGKYQFRPPLPFVIGMEGAGVIARMGRKCRHFRLGDKVMFKGKTGACSETITVHEGSVEPLPENLSFEEGAAFSVTFQTAYVALSRRANLQPGETVLISGAGGGVGQASVAVAKGLGATVIAMASHAEKLDIAHRSGADHLIHYNDYRFAEKVLDLTGGKGANVILDPVGGPVLEEGVKSLAWSGRLLTVGFASDSFGKVPLNLLQEKGASLVGVRAGEYGRRNPEDGEKAFQELVELTEACDLKPWIGDVASLAEVSDRLKAMQERRVLGKQIIRIDSSLNI